ncbi:MAG: hypothetical protein AAF490_22615, partial [Chloroflexota bacterium]
MTTKLYKPDTPIHFVNRARLEERLVLGKAGKVTLITAPAGFGKTTLISAWLNSLPDEHVCWFTIDEYDNDLSRFLHYFLAAWQMIDPSLGASSLKLLQEGWAGPSPITPEAILIPLINELAALQTEGVVVLDDWHLVKSQPIQNAIRYWIEHVPSSIHTILMSRELPEFPLARWRVRGQLNELVAEDLLFNRDEMVQFFKDGMKLDLTGAQIEQLAEKTEGWVASLQLAAFSLQNAGDPSALVDAFTGSNRYVVDYLVDEVLSQQEEPYRAFLQETAVLTRFNTELCDYVRQANDSAEILEEMIRRNIFIIPLDQNRQWYRYHSLFADYLSTALQQENAKKFKELNHRAFERLLAQEQLEEAINHGLAAEVYETIAQLLSEQSYGQVWHTNQANLFCEWCYSLPDETLIQLPELMAALGWALLFSGRRVELQNYLKKYKAYLFESAGDPDLRRQAIAIEAELYLHQGNSDKVLENLNQIEFEQLKHQFTKGMMYQVYGYASRIDGSLLNAIDALKQSRVITDSTEQVPLFLYASSDLIDALILHGNLNEAEQLIVSLFDQFPSTQHDFYPALHMISVYYGRIHFLRNEIGTAVDFVQRGLTLHAKIVSPKKVMRFGVLGMAYLQQAQGNWDKVNTLMNELEQFVRASGNHRLIAHYEANWALLNILQGNLAQAEKWASRFEFERPSSIPRLQHHEAKVVYGRYLLATQAPKAVSWLNNCLEEAQVNGWGLAELEINVLLAGAYHVASNHEPALAALQR